jgi:hypothetical protein
MNINLERAFDLIVHMRENAGEDYVVDKKKNIVLNPKQQSAVFHKVVQSFMQSVAVLDENKKIIQAFSGSSDLPQLTMDVFNVTQAVPNFDTLWQAAFKGIPLRKGQLSWEIADVVTGFAFELIPEGGKVKFYGISGSKTDAKIQKYGMGIGITWEMIEGRKLYQFVDQMEGVRAKLNNLWADTHYGLLATAALGQAVAWQGVATDPIVERDIATINKGYETIGSACKDKGYGDTANSPMVVYASPLLKARIMQAFRATSADIITGRQAGAASSKAGQVIEYAVTPKFTWNANIPSNKAVMVLPGNKVQNSVYLQELGLSERDIETLSELRTYWTAFGAIIADSQQTSELAFA